jgi:hypothetical protein
MSHFMFRFWNDPQRTGRSSLHNQIRWRHSAQVPGYQGDSTDRGQPCRFSRWYRLPKRAHQLYWRTHQNG